MVAKRRRERFNWNVITKTRDYRIEIHEIFPDELGDYTELCRSETGNVIPLALVFQPDAGFMLCVNQAATYCKNFTEKVQAFRRVPPTQKDMSMAVVFYAERKRRKKK